MADSVQDPKRAAAAPAAKPFKAPRPSTQVDKSHAEPEEVSVVPA